jgi:gas vesicle protein
MSERSGGGGFGAFLFGIVLGAVAGFVFAPTEGGESTRKKVTKGLRNLKELAEEKVDEVRGLLKEAADEETAEESQTEDSDEEDEEPEISTREQLRRRLEAARRRRARTARPPATPTAPPSEEEDEPLA